MMGIFEFAFVVCIILYASNFDEVLIVVHFLRSHNTDFELHFNLCEKF